MGMCVLCAMQGSLYRTVLRRVKRPKRLCSGYNGILRLLEPCDGAEFGSPIGVCVRKPAQSVDIATRSAMTCGCSSENANGGKPGAVRSGNHRWM